MRPDAFIDRLGGVRRTGEGRWMALCPAHEDRTQSLSVATGAKGILITCHAGCETQDILANLELGMADLFFEKQGAVASGTRQGKETVYSYVDENRELLFQVVRVDGPEGKRIRQRRPDPNRPDSWIWDLKGVRRPLYRLPELRESDPATPVFIVEGEKNADDLARLGLTATTNPHGAGKWRSEYDETFRRRVVVVLPDNDEPGQSHARNIAGHLGGVAQSLRVLELPDLGDKGDVSDWLSTGGTREKLLDLASKCPPWTTPPAAPTRSIDDEDADRGKQSQAQLLVELAQANATFFKTPADDAFALVERDGHSRTLAIKSRSFRLFLTELFFRIHGRSPSTNGLTEALNTIEAIAMMSGQTSAVEMRVGEADGRLYLDLTDDSWRVVEIDGQGWQILEGGRAPIRFRRSNTMRPLPVPTPGGSLDRLRTFINAGREENFLLLVSWLLYALQPRGPFPVLVLQGEQGSAKSTTARILRALIDPSQAPLRITPKQEQDLMLGARNSWILAFDNLSGMPPWLSDGICILATGGAYTTRSLYTNDEESVLEASRPVIVNGIDDMATRPDFASRAIVVTLPPIPEEFRREESELWKQFDEHRATILGALCSTVSRVLAFMPSVKLRAHPRMADFARWGVAVERALKWPAGSFLDAYQGNLSDSEALALEADPVASAVVLLMDSRQEWYGTATELLHNLDRVMPENRRGGRRWPTTPNVLTSRIRRAAVPLRKHGLEMDDNRTKDKRILVIRRIHPETAVTSVTTDTPEEIPPLGADDQHDGTVGPLSSTQPVTLGDDAPSSTVTGNAPGPGDGRDGDDGHDLLSTEGRRDTENGGGPPASRSSEAVPDGAAPPWWDR